ncbi:MAG: ACP S-malonyltransferase [Oleibacter sp.]|nr:ACP S-malonyltransferase [Thalassolituus sp.]
MTDVIAFFPGQGAQYIGMLADLAEHYPEVELTFAEASDALGFDLWALVNDASDTGEAVLNLTSNTQPALLAASVASWRIIKRECPALRVVAGAGHSLGEYSALVAADAIDFADAIRLVRRRGQLMEQAVPEGKGGMAAILGLDDDAIGAVCADAADAGVVEPANFNAPGQIVIAGESDAIERAIELAKAAGAKRALSLAVSGPFHSSLMRAAADDFAVDLKAIHWRAPKFPVYHNADNDVATLVEIPQRLLEQLYSPVIWTGAVAAVETKAAVAVEFGPGKVIAGLVKRINKELPVLGTGSVSAVDATIAQIQGLQP